MSGARRAEAPSRRGRVTTPVGFRTTVSVPVTTEIAEALTEARRRTLAMVEPFSDEQMETAHSALMSPLAWDLAHRGRAVGDARVERAEAELEAPALLLVELGDQRVEAPALLVHQDDVAGGDALGGDPGRGRRGRFGGVDQALLHGR